MKSVIVGQNKYKRKKFRHSVSVFPILVIGMVVVTSLMMASFLSTVITASGFGLINTSARTQSATVVWAISVGTCNTFAQAEELSQTTKTKGGGGVVLKKDVFHVLASAYEIENDALKVQNNLQTQGAPSQIVKMEVLQTSISSAYTLSEVSALDASLLAYKDAFRTLFDVSISLDTQTKTEISARETIVKLETRLEKLKSDFALHLNKKLTANLVALSLQNEKTLAWVKQLKETTKPLATETKTAYLSILLEQNDMLMELQTTVF